MADITMCTNVLCPNAPHCYRVQAIPDEYQSVCNFEYTLSTEGVLCDYYWSMLDWIPVLDDDQEEAP